MKLLTTLLLAASTATSFAVAEETILVTKTITSAANIEQDLAEVLPSASVITRWEIEQSPAATVIDLIQSEPGIEIGRNGGPGTVSSIFMRGQASKNVAVFIDGVKAQRDQYGSLAIIDIPTSNIDRIEILRGNMSALYGEGATGGAIHIFTRQDATQTTPYGALTLGSRETKDLTAGIQGIANSVTYNLAVQDYKTVNPSTINIAQQPNTNPDKDPYNRRSVYGSVKRKINENTTVGISGNRVNSRVHYDTNTGSNDDLFADQVTQDITVNALGKLTDRLQSNASITQSTYSYVETTNGSETRRSEGDQTSLSLLNTLSLDNDNVTFGLDGTDGDFTSSGSTHERTSIGLFTGLSGKSDIGIDYQLNLRFDEIKSEVASTKYTNKKDTWLAGLGYSINESTKLTAVYSTSFRAPGTAELSDTSSLLPEEHNGYELGIQHKAKNWTARLVSFDTDTKNAITYTGNGTMSGGWCIANCYENVGKSYNRGMEIEFAGYIGTIDYQISHVLQNPKDNNGNQLARRARNYNTLELNGLLSNLDWKVQIIHSSERDNSAYDSYTLKSYTVTNLSLGREIFSNWTAKLKLENVFDEKYQLAYGYDAVPFGAFLSIQYQPK
jgi:vitamin B12 transporter